MTFNIKRNGFRNYRQQFSRNPGRGKTGSYGFLGTLVGPIIDELATEYEGKVIIGKCDVDENGDVAAEYGIRNIPTVLFFKNGELVDKQVGSAPKSAYVAKIEAIL